MWVTRQSRQHSREESVDSWVCEVCGFDAYAVYGEDYCKVHHLTPLADLEEESKTTLEDVAIVCANCHRIIRVDCPPLTIEEIRQRLQPGRNLAR